MKNPKTLLRASLVGWYGDCRPVLLHTRTGGVARCRGAGSTDRLSGLRLAAGPGHFHRPDRLRAMAQEAVRCLLRYPV